MLIPFLVLYDTACNASAVVWAKDREHCKRVLEDRLVKARRPHFRPDNWTIEPLTYWADRPVVVLVADIVEGMYRC